MRIRQPIKEPGHALLEIKSVSRQSEKAHRTISDLGPFLIMRCDNSDGWLSPYQGTFDEQGILLGGYPLVRPSVISNRCYAVSADEIDSHESDEDGVVSVKRRVLIKDQMSGLRSGDSDVYVVMQRGDPNSSRYTIILVDPVRARNI